MNRQGWVPIRVLLRGSEPSVDWCWLGSQRLLDPFFDQTIDLALRRPFNGLFTHRTPIEELGRWYAASPGLTPSGFIFHMSRCGSTLVSQMLAALSDTVVVSEALPLDVLARATSVPEFVHTQWLRWMVSALGQKRAGGESRYFIKFDSSTVLGLPAIRRAFPDVPWIFLYRDPEEVLISQLRETAAAMTPGMATDSQILNLPFHEAASIPPVEFGARCLGHLCELAASHLDERGLLVNYQDLPAALLDGGAGTIRAHFEVQPGAADVETMRVVSQYHGKHPRSRFQPDTASKRNEVSAAVCLASDRWIRPHFEELERLRGLS